MECTTKPGHDPIYLMAGGGELRDDLADGGDSRLMEVRMWALVVAIALGAAGVAGAQTVASVTTAQLMEPTRRRPRSRPRSCCRSWPTAPPLTTPATGLTSHRLSGSDRRGASEGVLRYARGQALSSRSGSSL